MYEELIHDLMLHHDTVVETYSKDGVKIAETIYSKAANAIEELVKICNSILSKYEEEAEAMIWEYSGHIDEDIDGLHKEIEDYKARINGVAKPPKEE